MTIDAHQHFWKYDPVRDNWITDEMKVLKRDFFPDELARIYRENKIDGCVAVQADQSEKETLFLTGLANQNKLIKGVVGWVDFCSTSISDRLDYFSQFKVIKGFRHILQAEPSGFMNQREFQRGISKLEKHNFTYDILIYPHQLEEAIALVQKYPHQKFVIDHLAKPVIKGNKFDQWSKGMMQLVLYKNVSCKLSGFTTEADWSNWKPENFKRYFDFVLEQFGANRLMYGSDWPVCLLAASYDQQLSVVNDFISKLSNAEKQKIMGENAVKFYNL